jgi:hypothetical protein
MQKIEKLFGVDLRSLAAFRIGAAAIILLDLLFRSRELTAYFTDDGILPRIARIELIEVGDQFSFADTWSIHLMSGQYWVQAVLMLLAAAAAICLLVGHRTRMATIVSWVLLQSLDSRNLVLINSGDVLLRCLLLWGIFLPLGARFSLDRWRSQATPTARPRILSAASAAVLLQVAMMYFFSGLFKNHPAWLTECSGVYYALNCDSYVTSIGLWLRRLPDGLHSALTLSTIALEFLGALIVFSPWRTAAIRMIMIAAFWLFHLGLALTMTIGLFPIICIVAWLLFIPSAFWQYVGRRLQGTVLAPYTDSLIEHEDQESVSADSLDRPASGRILKLVGSALMNGLVFALLAYTIAWNIRELDFARWEETVMPRRYNRIGRALGLDQNWAMFAPVPRTEDGWIVMKGVLRDGDEVNLWDFDQPLPWDKPALVSATYKSQRWRKYLDNLTTEPYGLYRMHFADWLHRRWNEHVGDEEPQRQVVQIQLIHRLELTPPRGEPIPAPESRVLLTWYYD